MRSQSIAYNSAASMAAALADRPAAEYCHCPSCWAPYRPQTNGNGLLIDWCLRCGDVSALVAAGVGVAVTAAPPRKPYSTRRAVPESCYRRDLVCKCGRPKTIRDKSKRVPQRCDSCDPRAARRREYEADRRDRLGADA